MIHAFEDSFTPALAGVGQALYVAGGALTTMGFGTIEGEPPSALGLLECYASLGERDELAQVLRSARDWCATVLQSHASHPSLIYFRSAGTESGWPATLGALVDLALLLELVLDEPRLAGAAVLLRRQAVRLSGEAMRLLDLQPAALPDPRGDLAVVRERLRQAGYAVRGDIDVGTFAACRQRDAGGVEALARHLGKEGAPLLPAAPHPTIAHGPHRGDRARHP